MNKFIKNKILQQVDEAQEEIQAVNTTESREELLDEEEALVEEEIKVFKGKKQQHKHHETKPSLGFSQKLHLATHRTLSSTERLIQSLSKAYEHIFVGDETVGANFEKEYGLKYYVKSDYKNALKHFENYEQTSDKDDSDVLYMMGICYTSVENLKKAAECYEKANDLKPDDFDIVSQLAKTLLSLEDFEGALDYLKKSAEIAPDEPDTYYHLASCYEKLDQIEQAKKMYRKAIDLNPREAVYYHALGFLYENIGDHKDAIVCFKKAMDLERDRGGR